MPTGRHVDQKQRERVWAIVAEAGNRNLHEIAVLVQLDWQTVRDVVFSACEPALAYSRLRKKLEESDPWREWGP